MLREIRLHGALRREFGGSFRLDVATPIEAFRALMAQLPGFRQRIAEGEFTIIRGKRKTGWALDAETLEFPLGGEPLHIVPVASGSGKAGSVIKTVIGIIIVAAVFYFAPPAGPEAAGSMFGADLAASSAVFGISYGTLATIGVGMVASGIAGLIAPTPKFRTEERDSRQSFLFNNLDNVTTQGVPLPLIYGRMRVGSVVISASLETVESDGSKF